MTNTQKPFYQAMQTWVEAGLPYHNKYSFSKGVGLCRNLGKFAYAECMDYTDLRVEMKMQFKEAGLDETCPFNNNCLDYIDEAKKYANPRRLAWIRFHASDLVVQSKSVFYGLKDDDFIKLGKFHAKDFAEAMHPGYSLYMEEAELKAYNSGLHHLIGD